MGLEAEWMMTLKSPFFYFPYTETLNQVAIHLGVSTLPLHCLRRAIQGGGS